MGVYEDVTEFYLNFTGEKKVYGYSYEKKPLFAFFTGSHGKKEIIIQCGIHAREYVTCYLGMKIITGFKHFSGGGMWVLPLTNPDGAIISENGKPLYKANARGVDLNVNFDARWGSGKYNVRKAGFANFIGDYPFSESETRAMRDFTFSVNPDCTISYHSKGEEIYFDFFQSEKDYIRDKKIAEAYAEETGYKIVEGLPSSGGYKDWCVQTLKIPSLTVEVGADYLVHPINKSFAEGIYRQNKKGIEKIFEVL